MYVNSVVVLDFEREQDVSIGGIDGHVIGDAIAEGGVGQRHCGDKAEGRRQRRPRELLPAIRGLQQPNVGLGGEVRGKAAVGDVEGSVRASPQENVSVEGAIVVGGGKLYRRGEVLAVISRAGEPDLGTESGKQCKAHVDIINKRAFGIRVRSHPLFVCGSTEPTRIVNRQGLSLIAHGPGFAAVVGLDDGNGAVRNHVPHLVAGWIVGHAERQHSREDTPD